VKGGPNGEGGRRLVEFLVGESVERELLRAGFLAYLVRGEVGVKGMGVEYGELARVMPRAVGVALEVLEGR
jgi:hypothetical protein